VGAAIEAGAATGGLGAVDGGEGVCAGAGAAIGAGAATGGDFDGEALSSPKISWLVMVSMVNRPTWSSTGKPSSITVVSGVT
jgi:hypothetical protein